MNVSSTPEVKEKSIKEVLHQYSRYWYWFFLGIILMLTGAYIFLRYATSTYETNSTIVIKDDKKNGGMGALAAFTELSFFSRAFSDKIESELVILNSKTLLLKAVKELDLYVEYYARGAIKSTELYAYKPFKINFLNLDDNSEKLPPKLTINIVSDIEFTIEDEAGSINEKHNFGDIIELSFGDVVVTPDLVKIDRFKTFINKTIDVFYYEPEDIAIVYQEKIKLIHDGKKGEVVNLQLTSSTPQKAEDFLNEVVYQYNQDAINDRSRVAQKTSRFIDSRLEIITRELDSVERNKEAFKSNNRLTDIEAEAQLILQNVSEFNKRQVDVSTQLELLNSMVDHLDRSTNFDLLPSNIGLKQEEISSSVSTYNQLVLERNRLLENSTIKNPVIANLDAQIGQLKFSISSGLNNQRTGIQLALKDLNIQERKFNSKLSRVPTQEKLFRGIVRQQNIKEQLYLFLLQQREEASISLAVTSSKAKVVDPAYSGKLPVFPKKPLVYLVALVIGLLIPFLLIYLYYLFNTKISNRRDVERVHMSPPLIGEIPKLGRGDDELIQHNDRSILAESFRILRTNLQYLLVNKTKNGQAAKNILVTSTIKGEGKTFVAFNLALSLAQTGKKVVLVGADIRNPQLHRYLHNDYKSHKGLTEYIIDDSIIAADLVIKSQQSDNLSIVMSGIIPPNPAELLMQNRTTVFFEEVADLFDYIIVDTAPTMLVTDTILINKLSDVTLYVVRANYTDKKLLKFPFDAIKDGRLSNVALILNSVALNNFGYGNKYGYTYTEEKKSFWNRLFSR